MTDSFKILTRNNIATEGLDRFPRERYEVGADLADPHAILVRSYNMHDMRFRPVCVPSGARAPA
jgi:D-3-phosphoglycerate dehydrogenase